MSTAAGAFSRGCDPDRTQLRLQMSIYSDINAKAFRTSMLPTFGDVVTYKPSPAAGADSGFTFELRACIQQPPAEMAAGQMPFAAAETVKPTRVVVFHIEVPTTEVNEDETGQIAEPVAGSNECVTSIGGVKQLRPGDSFVIPGKYLAKGEPVTLSVRSVRYIAGKWIGVCNG